MSFLNHAKDESNDKLPESFRGMGADHLKGKEVPRHDIGAEIKNKQTSIYLDLDVIEVLDKVTDPRKKSQYINNLLVHYFGLQERKNGIIFKEFKEEDKG